MVIIVALFGGVSLLVLLWLGVVALSRRSMRHRWMDQGDEDADAAYSGRFPGH